MGNAESALKDTRISFLVALAVLIVQFLLGMGVNLFVTVPTNHPGSNPPEYFSGVAQSVSWALLHGPALLILHASLGLLLVVASIGVLVRSRQTRIRAVVVSAAIGALAVLAAGFNGGSYLNYHEDFSSMIMAGAFGVAVLSYAVGLYLTARPAATA